MDNWSSFLDILFLIFTILDGMSGCLGVSMCAYAHVQAPGQPWVLSSGALQLGFWSLVSLEFTWGGLASWAVCLGGLLAPPTQNWDYKHVWPWLAFSHEKLWGLNSGLVLGLSNWALSSAPFLYIHNAEGLTPLKQMTFFFLWVSASSPLEGKYNIPNVCTLFIINVYEIYHSH